MDLHHPRSVTLGTIIVVDSEKKDVFVGRKKWTAQNMRDRCLPANDLLPEKPQKNTNNDFLRFYEITSRKKESICWGNERLISRLRAANKSSRREKMEQKNKRRDNLRLFHLQAFIVPVLSSGWTHFSLSSFFSSYEHIKFHRFLDGGS